MGDDLTRRCEKMSIQSVLSTENRRLAVNLSLSQDAHRALLKLATERKMAMSRVVEDLVSREAARGQNRDHT